MNLYIQRNLQINQIFHQFASKKEVWPYSIDEIHRRFGFTKLVYTTSLLPGGTAIERAALVGRHNGGNSYE